MAAAAAASKGGRILVVDDDPMVRETLGQMLADEGYIVDTAIDGADALVRVRTARPDAILLDLMMPGMNGRQFLHALRDDTAYEAVRVLIMTAVHGLEINLTMIGASDIVEKPFNADELLNKVALAVYRSREADRLASVPFSPAPAELTPPPMLPTERGVVLVVEHDRSRLQQLDLLLSERGYTVVSMTRAMAQFSRLARALRPRAILLELLSDGVAEVVSELRAEQGLARIPILVFARDKVHGEHPPLETLERASDLDLVGFVERQR